MEDIIIVENLSKQYDGITAVNNISFTVREGQFFSFLGPNGAGKSTTIKILSTLLNFDQGNIMVGDKSLNKQNDAIKKEIGIVFQDNYLDDLLTVYENLYLRGKLYYKDKNKIKNRIQSVSQITGLNDILNQRYGTLSGGQKRRADIARALLHEPRLLILDEPTTGLDPKTRQSVWNMIKSLQENNNMTVFLTTHYMEEAAQSDYIVMINHGDIVVEGTPLELKEKFAVDVLYLYFEKHNTDILTRTLKMRGIDYTLNNKKITINLIDTKSALPILNQIQDYIEGFEVVYGNMDTVFLNVMELKQGENE